MLLSLCAEFIKLRLSAPTQTNNKLIHENEKKIKSGFNLTIGYKSSYDPKLIESEMTPLEILHFSLKMGAARDHFRQCLFAFAVRLYLPVILFSRLAIFPSSTFKRDRKSFRNSACDVCSLSCVFSVVVYTFIWGSVGRAKLCFVSFLLIVLLSK
jgi:hypothetical protein